MEKRVFSNDLKIARVFKIAIFKGGGCSKLGNYRPILVLPRFSKISENIIYNHFHKYVLENTVLYPKQFGFEVGYSADHAIIQLDDQIFEAFENNLYTLGVFIDLSKKPLKD